LVVVLLLIGKGVYAQENSIIWKVNTHRKQVALTFDDGPRPEPTAKILKILNQLQAKATFFLVGNIAEKQPDTVYSIIAQGHEVANHTFSHSRLEHMPLSQTQKEISLANNALSSITGFKVKYFRPPGGKYTSQSLEIIKSLGMKMIMWDVNANDYVRVAPFYGIQGENSSNDICKKVLDETKNGSIILMHNGSKETIKALPYIIMRLRQEGYHLVTISELLK
jgi:peptidoglycan-N-acetylglucosamine deacetylase